MRTHSECGAFVDHLRLEHRHLQDAVRAIVVAMDEWAAARGYAERRAVVIERLNQLRDELVGHFTEEETGGCMDEAVSRCPSMSTDAKAVAAEHPVLTRELDRIIARAVAPATSAEEAGAVVADFRAFAKRLHVHESAENRILCYGFGAEAADADVNLDCSEE